MEEKREFLVEQKRVEASRTRGKVSSKGRLPVGRRSLLAERELLVGEITTRTEGQL